MPNPVGDIREQICESHLPDARRYVKISGPTLVILYRANNAVLNMAEDFAAGRR